MSLAKPLTILVAGPYRSGTNDDPRLIEKNMDLMNEIALEVYQMGHLPMLGEWIALPLIHTAGGKQIGDDIFNEIFHPSSIRLMDACDAVLRVGGPSKGADEMVSVGKAKNKQIFFNLDELPTVHKHEVD